jgi:signal transduction histidine kinase
MNSFDPTRFQHVLSNLLINAVKHSEQEKKITLSVHGDPESITVEVKNLGFPIPPEFLQVIFNPLVQLSTEETHSPSSTGTGVGLYIAREIVEGHNGLIEVSSSETAGTIFKVRLPRNRSNSQSRFFGRTDHICRAKCGLLICHLGVTQILEMGCRPVSAGVVSLHWASTLY